MKLTQRDIPRLSVGEYRDDEVNGLLFRVRGTGLRSFELRYTLPASRERKRLTIGDATTISLDDARRKARKLIGGVWTGSDPARDLRRTGGITIGQLAARYMSSVPLASSTRRQWNQMIAADLASIAHREAATFKRAEVAEWASAIAERAGYVGNRAFAMLRRFYSWGAAQGLLEGTPFVGLQRPFAGEKKRMRFLSKDEVRALLGALDELAHTDTKARYGEHFAVGAELLLLTGVRLNSMLEARRSQFVDLDRPDDAEWRIPPVFQKLREKTRSTEKPYVSPLPRQAVALVRRRIEATAGADILFPRTKAARKVGKSTAWWGSNFIGKLRAGMDARLDRPAMPWTTHGLRNTIVTHMEDFLGVSPVITDAILAHKGTGPSRAHAIYSSAEHVAARRVALQDWADWLDSLRWAPMRKAEPDDIVSAGATQGPRSKKLRAVRPSRSRS